VKVLGFVKFCEPSSIFTQYLRVGIYIGRCKGTMCSKKRWDLPTVFFGCDQSLGDLVFEGRAIGWFAPFLCRGIGKLGSFWEEVRFYVWLPEAQGCGMEEHGALV
jgi:hypothetical protein